MTNAGDPKTVAVIGLGNMGSALAEALLAGGNSVTVWNRTRSKCNALATLGVIVAETISEVVELAQVIVVCVTNHDASVSLLQTNEVAATARGKLLVQLSTVTAEESRDMGRWASEHGIDYLDGSILALPQPIRDNSATIVYSGPREVFAAAESVLAAMGGNPKLVGEAIGGAPTFDKALYAWHYGSMLAFFHGAAICHEAEFPIEIYLEEIFNTGDTTLRRYGERIARRNYEDTDCTLEVHAAAYEHVINLSRKLGVETAFPQLVADTFKRAIDEGHGQQDLPVVFEMLLPE